MTCKEAICHRGERESGPDSGTEFAATSVGRTLNPCEINGLGNETQTEEAAENPGKSFLFCLRDRDHGILSEGEMVLAIAVKGYPEERRVSAASVVVFGLALENSVGG